MLFRYLTWTFDNRYFTLDVDLIHGCLVGAALVHRHLLGNTTGLHGLVKKALDSQQKVDRLSLLVHRAVKVFSGVFDLDVRFIRAPAAYN